MKITRQQEKAIKQLFTAKGWPQRIAALTIVAAAAFTWWQQDQVKPGQMVKGGQIIGKVINVADGDTITLQDAEHKQYKLRLAYIDAPESAMPFGPESKQHLNQLVGGKQVEARVDDVDAYGRGVARILREGKDINLAQVDGGYAWHYSQYAKKGQDQGQFARYQQAQQSAKKEKEGLWRAPSPMPPWDWRRQNKIP